MRVEELYLENGNETNYEEKSGKMSSSRSLRNTSMSKTNFFDHLWSQLVVAYREHRIDEAFDLKNKIIEGNFPLTSEQE